MYLNDINYRLIINIRFIKLIFVELEDIVYNILVKYVYKRDMIKCRIWLLCLNIFWNMISNIND